MKKPSFAAQLMLGLHAHPLFNRQDIAYFVQTLGHDPTCWSNNAQTLNGIRSDHQQLLDSLSCLDSSNVADVMPYVDDLLSQLEKYHVGILCPSDEDFPAQLKQLTNVPSLLFYRGNPSLLGMPQVAMVGSRQASLQGLRASREFAYQFAKGGFVITSGLARGVDSAAHRGCLDAEGHTIAVMACGLDTIYPKKHKGLGQEILEKGGLLLSEYPLGMPPLPHQFPIRNRIITGLSQALLVVEAGLHSGSVVSAKWAAEQGIDVYALPGSIYSPQSEGCLELIKQGATLATSPADVVAGVQWDIFDSTKSLIELSSEAQNILSFLSSDPIGADQIIQHTQYPAARVMAALAECEVAGHITMVANRYVRR